jgi:hypothetical protein
VWLDVCAFVWATNINTMQDAHLLSHLRWQLTLFDASPPLFRALLPAAEAAAVEKLSDEELRALLLDLCNLPVTELRRRIQSGSLAVPVVRKEDLEARLAVYLQALKKAFHEKPELLRRLSPTSMIDQEDDATLLAWVDYLFDMEPTRVKMLLFMYLSACTLSARLNKTTNGRANLVLGASALVFVLCVLFILLSLGVILFRAAADGRARLFPGSAVPPAARAAGSEYKWLDENDL